MENDVSEFDCRKSNVNRLTQFVPEPLRAKVFELFNQGLQPFKIEKWTDHYYMVFYTNQLNYEDMALFYVNESNYWDCLSHVEVDEVIQLPIQPK